MAEELKFNVKTNIADAAKDVEGFSKGLKKAKGNQKDLNKEAKDSIGNFTMFGVSLNGVKTAFGKIIPMAKGMFGSIKAGLISTGIGAFLVLIGSLIAYFKSTKDGAEKLERAMAGFGAVVSVITDRLSTFGKVIVSAFENPQQAIKDLWEAIKTNIVNRVEGLFDTFGALGDTIKAAFSLDWEGVKAGAADFSESMIQTATGVDDLTGKMAAGFKSLGDEIEKDVTAAMKLKGLTQQLKDEEREFAKVRAQTRQDIQKARLDALDETKTVEERLAAVQKANDLELKTTEDVLKMQRRKIEVQKETMALSENMAEDLDELASLEVELIDLQTASFQTQKRLATEMETLQNEIAAKDKARAKEKEDREEAADKKLKELRSENLLAEIEDLQERALKELEIQEAKELASLEAFENFEELKFEVEKKYDKKRGEITKKKVEDEKKWSEMSQKEQLGIAQSTFNDLSTIMGKESKAGKAAAIAAATIDTYKGATSAFSAMSGIPVVGPALGAIAAAAAVAAGLANVKAILATGEGGGSVPSAPSGGGVSGGVPSTTVASGAFTLGGGTEPEPARAYVVSDDITNSQNKLANIRRRATI